MRPKEKVIVALFALLLLAGGITLAVLVTRWLPSPSVTPSPVVMDTTSSTDADSDASDLTYLSIDWASSDGSNLQSVDYPADFLPVMQAIAKDENGKVYFEGILDGLAPRAVLLGRVNAGLYKDSSLIRVSWDDNEGLGSVVLSAYFLQQPTGETVFLSSMGDEYYWISFSNGFSTQSRPYFSQMLEAYKEAHTHDDGVAVSFPGSDELLLAPNGTYLKLQSVGTRQFSQDQMDLLQNSVLAKEPQSGEQYQLVSLSGKSPSMFYYLRPDGYVAYYYALPPWNTDLLTTSVYWDDKQRNDIADYSYFYVGGCGRGGPDTIDQPEDIVKAGKIVWGRDGKTEDIYLPDWSVDTVLKNEDANSLYQNYLMRRSWEEGEEMEEAGYIDEFLSEHPVFYWKDSFGRWTRFTKTNVQPTAECGKPVIYLYPPVETDVSVGLTLEGGFSYTEPDYGAGWNVVASPDGALVNKADGKVYPYLFWEGRGGAYVPPTQFWVIARADVPSFLDRTLHQMGLNDQEVVDFREYWEPKMQAAPYYKIGFHGTNVMNALAPMSVTPKPDVVFRVLMDYDELEAPISANPPSFISPFIRRGFTVVEWGGVLHEADHIR